MLDIPMANVRDLLAAESKIGYLLLGQIAIIIRKIEKLKITYRLKKSDHVIDYIIKLKRDKNLFEMKV